MARRDRFRTPQSWRDITEERQNVFNKRNRPPPRKFGTTDADYTSAIARWFNSLPDEEINMNGPGYPSTTLNEKTQADVTDYLNKFLFNQEDEEEDGPGAYDATKVFPPASLDRIRQSVLANTNAATGNLEDGGEVLAQIDYEHDLLDAQEENPGRRATKRR